MFLSFSSKTPSVWKKIIPPKTCLFIKFRWIFFMNVIWYEIIIFLWWLDEYNNIHLKYNDQLQNEIKTWGVRYMYLKKCIWHLCTYISWWLVIYSDFIPIQIEDMHKTPVYRFSYMLIIHGVFAYVKHIRHILLV